MAGITFGLVPHPDFTDHPLTKAEGNGQNNLGQRKVLGVVYHRMIGSLMGTDGYFAMPSTGALTDYGVGVAATDGTANDGRIIRWNNPLGHQSGWASGPVNAPYGDGAAFINKYGDASGIGVNVVNRDQASIEISGNYDTALSPKAKASIAALTAYWADQYRIPWDQFPIAPQDGFSFVRWHQEFTIGTGKICPGPVVMDATPELIDLTKAILKEHQVSDGPAPEPTPEYPKPSLPTWLKTDDGKTIERINKTKVLPLQMEYTVMRDTQRRQATGKNTRVIGPDLKAGEVFRAGRVYRSSDENGKSITVVLTPDGTRVKAADLFPKVQVTSSGVVSVRYE